MKPTEVSKPALALAVGDPLADQVFDGSAELERVSVPGIDRTVVWRVRGEAGDHPLQVYVGIWPDGRARVLTANQEAWADLVAATGVQLTEADQARSYLETYLEVTRGAMVIVEPVKSLDDLHWRPGSSDEERARADLLANPPDIASVASETDDGFHVELPLVVDQRLQRNAFDVTREGEITHASYEVFADNLPLPIAR